MSILSATESKQRNSSVSRMFVRNLYFPSDPKKFLRGVLPLSELNWKAIIEAAVKVEEQSIALYTMALENAKYPSSKVFLKELVKEEKGHKMKLEAIMKNQAKISELGSQGGAVQDLKIIDMLQDTPLSSDADYEAILVYAAKREKSTYDYYKTLALGLKGTAMGEMFSKLAQEELGHKNKLEKEYDDCVLTEN
jgi:rubrerythrin